MNYILKGETEGQRLDDQIKMKEFSLKLELEGILIPDGARVLDAGCGSGVLCRYLEEQFPKAQISGCDISESSLAHARKHTRKDSTKYYVHNLIDDPFSASYDFIFNRLVAHHLNEVNYRKMIQNFYRALNPGGKICIIDPDGIFLNLGTTSLLLREKMEKVRAHFHGNLSIARFIPAILAEEKFTSVAWRIEIMDFKGASRELEVKQWQERFESSLSFYIDLFGSELEARRFFKEYTSEAKKESVPLFYNKFIISAEK